MISGKYYNTVMDIAEVCLKEAKSDEGALHLINSRTQGIAEEAYKMYIFLKENQYEGNAEK